HCERRKNTSDSARVKLKEAELVLFELGEDDSADEEPGNHEKDVNPNKAAANDSWESVKTNDSEDGDGAKAVNIRPIGELAFRQRTGTPVRCLCICRAGQMSLPSLRRSSFSGLRPYLLTRRRDRDKG